MTSTATASPDLVIFDYNLLEVWHGGGDGSFSLAQTITTSRFSTTFSAAAIVDLDQDGFPDLLIAGYNGAWHLCSSS